MLYLLDINVWIALTADSHEHHTAAQGWLQKQQPGTRFAFCLVSQLAFLRLLSSRTIMGQDAVTPGNAWQILDLIRRDSRVLLLQEPANLELSFREATSDRLMKPGDWTDTYLAVFARLSGYSLVTFDRRLAEATANAVLLP